MSIPAILRELFGRGSQRLVVAFSGGPDSTALLWGLRQVAGDLRLEIFAAHLDHGLDDDSTRRAQAARELAQALCVPFFSERLTSRPAASESPEAWARAKRYVYLHRLADDLDADSIATAHHADDQAETVLLRLLYGSGLDGLAGIYRRRGRVVRPLLDLRRRHLCEALAAQPLDPVIDPTNLDREIPRNHVRHRLLPVLEARDPRIVERLCALAQAAAGASRRWDTLLATALRLRERPPDAGDGEHPVRYGAELDRRALERLPEPLFSLALAALGRRAGAAYPAGAPARRELRRQLRNRARIGCDCGRGWRWQGDRATLRLLGPETIPPVPSSAQPAAAKPKTPKFAYTLEVPGEVKIPELALRVCLRRGEVAPWMFRGRVDRAGLAWNSQAGRSVVIRNRRPGDRLQPLGGAQPLRLKDLLIARRIPREQRDRIPLMVIDGRIAWVPGVTIDERFRLRDENTAWIAEIRTMTESVAELPAPTTHIGPIER